MDFNVIRLDQLIYFKCFFALWSVIKSPIFPATLLCNVITQVDNETRQDKFTIAPGSFGILSLCLIKRKYPHVYVYVCACMCLQLCFYMYFSESTCQRMHMLSETISSNQYSCSSGYLQDTIAYTDNYWCKNI